MEKSLSGKVAIVAGASRGSGRGIALALGEAGATVYVTGRTMRGGTAPADGAPGTIEDTAEEVTRRGGQGFSVCVDHTDPEQVGDLFHRIRREQDRLDILACAVWGGNERYLDPLWKQPFWEQPVKVWRECVGAGPHAFWIASHAAARVMAEQRSGLITVVSEPILESGFEGQHASIAEGFWHIAHYSTNWLVRTLAPDAGAAGIAVIGLLPGFMKTERVEMHLGDLGEESRKEFRYDLAESTELLPSRATPKCSPKQASLSTSRTLPRSTGSPTWTASA